MALPGELYVDQFGDRGGAVSEDVLDLVDLHALFVEQGGARVAKVMKPDVPDAGPVEQADEMPVEVARFDRCPDAAGEDQPRLDPVSAFSGAFRVLCDAVLPQGRDARAG